MQPAVASGADGGRLENPSVAVTALSRRCSRCGQSGHNLRTCLEHREPKPAGEGVASASDSAAQPALRRDTDEEGASDDSSGRPARERKKGISWTEEEHRLFLLGLHKLGKGDWRGISRHYVQTRSPTQVASHAQKYFIRQAAGKRKRRSSLFDTTFPETDKAGQPPTAGEGQPAVKAEHMGSQMPAAPADGPQFPFPMLPGLPNGADPAAAAFWYQSLFAQQHPAAMMQAFFGSNPGSAGPMLNNPALAHLMASQGIMTPPPPPFMNPATFPFMPNQPPNMPPNMAATQGQSMANAYLAQQHLAAAFALGAMPFNMDPGAHPPPPFPGFYNGFPPLMHPPHAAEPQAPLVKEEPGKADVAAGALEGSFRRLCSSSGQEGPPQQDRLAQPKAMAALRLSSLEGNGAESSSQTYSGSSEAIQFGQPLQYPRSRSAKNSVQERGESARRTQSNPDLPLSKKSRWLAREPPGNEPPPESFGNGVLIRPQALKACQTITPGEMPSYMSSGSGDLQSTGLRLGTLEPSTGHGSSFEECSGSASYSPGKGKSVNDGYLREGLLPAGSSLATSTHM